MVETTVTNLQCQYLDCVKLLINEPWPDDLPEVLDDVIYKTKMFSEEIKAHRLTSESKSGATAKFSLNTVSRKKSYKMENEIAPVISPMILKGYTQQQLNPVVYIMPLKMENEIGPIKPEMKSKRTRTQKKSQFATSDKENTNPGPRNREDKGKYISNMSDGCIIN